MRSVLITLRLRMVSAGGVGAPERREWHEPDEQGRTRNLLPLRRDPTGELHVPGSTVAGNLRAHCAEVPELGGCFGGEPGESKPRPSTVQVLGTRILGAPETGIATRTAIDRDRAAARTNALHATERLPAGTVIEVFLRWDDEPAALPAFLDRLRSWAPRLGRGASTGAGRCVLVGLGQRTYDLGTAAGLLDWLAIRGPEDYPEPTAVDVPAVADARWRVGARVVGFLRVGDGRTRETDEHEVATAVRDAEGNFVVPGSTLKGVLRSRVEYVCRVLGAAACLDGTCGDCRPCLLFGHGARESDGLAGRARIACHDAPITGGDGVDRKHVALDRFTGGARPTLLFTLEAVSGGRFEIVVEELAELDPVDLLLLDAALNDLHDGLVGLGARTTAGYGTVRLDGWTAPDLTGLPALLGNGVAR